jgi:hypothetical protein
MLETKKHRPLKPIKVYSKNVALVCATKDQPDKVKRLLSSLSLQTSKPGQIIVCESGNILPGVIDKYIEDFNISYLKSPYVGQVLQRNYAYDHIDNGIMLVINIDDDVTLHQNSLENFLMCWNEECCKNGLPLGGMSFNLTDAETPKNSIFRNIFYQGVSMKGTVNISGYASTHFPTLQTLDAEWLIGGATGWDRSIIKKYAHPIDFPTRWAVCEDLMFSYPLRKSYRLLVAKNALAEHNENYSAMTIKKGTFYGLSLVIMRFYFVSINKDLSKIAFTWMTLGQLVGYMLMGIRGDRRSLGFCLGGISGLFLCFLILFKKRTSKELAKMLFYKK